LSTPRATRTIRLRRVGVTGLGAVTPLGNDVPSSWKALLEGVSGIARIEGFPLDDQPVKIAGQLKGFEPTSVLDRKDVRRFDPFLHYAVSAAQQAVDDSGLRVDAQNAERVGTLIGSGVGGLHSLERACSALFDRGPSRVSPFFVPQISANMASGFISIRFGMRGPNSCVVTACATGTQAIGEAFRLIQYGQADAMIAGGTEAAVTPLGMAAFAAMRALSTRNDEPQRASRPFERNRDGFVNAEGAGIVVLENLESARARGARILAEVVGYGMSSDAYHITAPREDGGGARGAMQRALDDAGLEPSAIDYINAHGTSTLLNDRSETKAIRQVFGKHADRLMVSSSKSMTGHALGAAGGIEAVFTILALQEGRIPPTINYEEADPGCDLDYVPNQARDSDIALALSNSFGFGGANASLALARYSTAKDETEGMH